MQYWAIQTLNSLALGGLLFLLAAGFSLIFGLMRIANLTHGGLFMLGAYLGVTVMRYVPNLWLGALAAGLTVALFGGLLERFILRKLGGNVLSQVLVTLGVSFIIADACLMAWGGDPIPVPTPPSLQMPVRLAGFIFPAYRLAVVVIAVLVALGLYLLMEKTRLGAMIRAGVDADMLPLALIVVILGGVGSLLGAFAGAFITGFVYTFGVALLPDLAYVILFLPMILVIAFRPRGLFGKFAA